MYVYMCVYMYVYMYVYMRVYMCVYMCVYMYVYMRVHVCVCQCVSDQLALRASSGMSSLCSLLAVIGQTQSDLLAIAPAKLVSHSSFVGPLPCPVIDNICAVMIVWRTSSVEDYHNCSVQ